ncbi:hypothetical protein F5B17DRAFT_451937 [Nemania serpens]|nr:hypothetical protein F5B17DRAFT_451937 [Nemania serpens]
MPAGERSNRQAQGLDYGASMASENVDFATESSTETPGTRDRALLDKLKDALKPGDARRFAAGGDTTHDGRHGGIEEVMQPGHRDYQENPHPHRGSVLDELGERGHARESVRGGTGLEETGTGGGGGGRNHARRPSILEKMPFGLGQRMQENSKRHENQHQSQSQSQSQGGGATTKKEVGSGAHEHHRDSTHMRTADENHFPGSMYRSLRDDFGK